MSKLFKDDRGRVVEQFGCKCCGPSFVHQYSAEAVNKAIEASNGAGRKIGPREATLIHGLLKGRPVS